MPKMQIKITLNVADALQELDAKIQEIAPLLGSKENAAKRYAGAIGSFGTMALTRTQRQGALLDEINRATFADATRLDVSFWQKSVAHNQIAPRPYASWCIPSRAELTGVGRTSGVLDNLGLTIDLESEPAQPGDLFYPRPEWQPAETESEVNCG